MAMARDFGIITIPMQVLLDHSGNVVFKHSGYIPTKELSAKIDNLLIKVEKDE
jgi:thioredoxin-related protein